jgi:cell wall-associated NlpC family hydrolase
MLSRLPRALRAAFSSLAVAVSLVAAMAQAPAARGAAAPDARRTTMRAADVRAPRVGARRHRVGVRVADLARRFVGVTYVWGGESPAGGFDCSGLVRYVFGRLGVSLPHNAAAQFGYGRAITRGSLEPGDLVFFSELGHVGIYVGHGRFVHAPFSGARVRVEPLRHHGSYDGARRVRAS